MKEIELKKQLIKKTNELEKLEDKFSTISQRIESLEDLMFEYTQIEHDEAYFKCQDKLYILEDEQGNIQDKIEDCEFAISVLKQEIKKAEYEVL